MFLFSKEKKTLKFIQNFTSFTSLNIETNKEKNLKVIELSYAFLPVSIGFNYYKALLNRKCNIVDLKVFFFYVNKHPFLFESGKNNVCTLTFTTSIYFLFHKQLKLQKKTF